MSSQSLDSSDKSLLLNAFNTQLFEFIEDIELVFSEDSSIKKAKTSILMIKKTKTITRCKMPWVSRWTRAESSPCKTCFKIFVTKH